MINLVKEIIEALFNYEENDREGFTDRFEGLEYGSEKRIRIEDTVKIFLGWLDPAIKILEIILYEIAKEDGQ